MCTDTTKSFYVKKGSGANIGDIVVKVVKVEVQVQGDAKGFDVIRNVINGIRYLEGSELIESLKSGGGTDADHLCLVERLAIQHNLSFRQPLHVYGTFCRPTSSEPHHCRPSGFV